MSINFWIITGLIVIGAIYGTSKYKRLPDEYRALTIMLGILIVTQLLMTYGSYVIRNNLFVGHILIPFTVGLVGASYYFLFRGNSIIQRRILISGALIVATLILNSIFFQSIWEGNTLGFVLEALYIIPLSLLFFYQMMRNPREIPLLQDAAFYFNVGNLLFYSLTYFDFALTQYILANDQLDRPYWFYVLSISNNFILYSLYIITLYYGNRRPIL